MSTCRLRRTHTHTCVGRTNQSHKNRHAYAADDLATRENADVSEMFGRDVNIVQNEEMAEGVNVQGAKIRSDNPDELIMLIQL